MDVVTTAEIGKVNLLLSERRAPHIHAQYKTKGMNEKSLNASKLANDKPRASKAALE